MDGCHVTLIANEYVDPFCWQSSELSKFEIKLRRASVCMSSVITSTFPIDVFQIIMSDPTYYIPLDLVHVWWYQEHVWWCLGVSDACLVVSGGVNVYRQIWPELIDVYGQISLPVHVTDDAETLMRRCCWCIVAEDILMLLMRWRCWCTDVANALMLLMFRCAYNANALMLMMMN